jgi:hypothetical protein
MQAHLCVVELRKKLLKKSQYVQIADELQDLQPGIYLVQKEHIELFEISTI